MSRAIVAAEFGGEFGEHFEVLETIVATIQKYGRVTNLSASLRGDDLWLQVGEALLMARALRAKGQLEQHWADIGSGGGFPGLIIAGLLRESQNVRGCLMEPRKRRVDFLQLALLDLRISNCVPEQGSLSETGKIEGARLAIAPNWVSARAVFEPEEWRRRASRAWPGCTCVLHLPKDSERLKPEGSTWSWRNHRIDLIEAER